MKNILLILSVLFTFSCKSKTYPLEHDDFNNLENGNYLKDINGYFNKFIGKWKYTNGSEVMIVKIEKAEHIEFSDYSMDKIVGGYKYIKDGNIIYEKDNKIILSYI